MFRIRSVTPADLDILTDIEAQSFPEAEKATRESFEKRLAVFSDHFLILEDAGRPVGSSRHPVPPVYLRKRHLQS